MPHINAEWVLGGFGIAGVISSMAVYPLVTELGVTGMCVSGLFFMSGYLVRVNHKERQENRDLVERIVDKHDARLGVFYQTHRDDQAHNYAESGKRTSDVTTALNSLTQAVESLKEK